MTNPFHADETPERFARLQALFRDALGRPPEERKDYAESACAGDSALLADLLGMLEMDAGGASWLDADIPTLAHRLVGLPGEEIEAELGPYRLLRMLRRRRHGGRLSGRASRCRNKGRHQVPA